MNNKVLVGGLIGGVASFLLGWLIYGVTLGPMLEEHMMPGLSRPEEEYQWAFLILGSILQGFLFAYILNKAGANSFGSGATVGAVVAFLMALSLNCTFYATSNMYASMTGIFIDVVAFTLMGLLLGGIIGWWYGRGRTAVVA